MDAKIRAGVIGSGGIGISHIEEYGLNPAVELVAISDISDSNLKKSQERYNIKGYKDYREMLKNETLNAISICTPPNIHPEIVKECVDRKINVLCEKPLAVDLESAEKMVDEANSAGVLLMTAYRHRFIEPNMKAKEWLNRGDIGKLITFRNKFAGKEKNYADGWRAKKEISGGGVLMDTASHSVDLFRFFAGDVKDISAHCNKEIQGVDVETTGVMLLRSENGVIGIIECSCISGGLSIIELTGEKGAIVIDYITREFKYSLEGGKWQIEKWEMKKRLGREVEHFVNCILGKEKLSVTGEDGKEALRVVLEAYKSCM